MGSWADEVEQNDPNDPNDQFSHLTHWENVLLLSKNRDNDKFNDRGVNISSQKRRQNLIPWVLVDYSAKNHENLDDPMDVDDCKKNLGCLN